MIQGFYFITDHTASRHGNSRDVQYALDAGVGVIQYRHKDAPTCLLYEEAAHLRALCDKALFLINDRIDIALAVGADGVHLGQEDMPIGKARALLGPDAVIGVTVCTLDEAQCAHRGGANYLGVGPIFPTATKRDAGLPVGSAVITQIKHTIDLPIVAIGGITVDNAPEVIAAGADSLCAIAAVLSSGNVHNDVIRFQRLFPTEKP